MNRVEQDSMTEKNIGSKSFGGVQITRIVDAKDLQYKVLHNTSTVGDMTEEELSVIDIVVLTHNPFLFAIKMALLDHKLQTQLASSNLHLCNDFVTLVVAQSQENEGFLLVFDNGRGVLILTWVGYKYDLMLQRSNKTTKFKQILKRHILVKYNGQTSDPGKYDLTIPI